MSRRRGFGRFPVVLVLVLAACGGGGSKEAGTTGGATGKVEPAECGLDAFRKANGPVEITFWHTQGADNDTLLKQITERFNAQQQKVRVKLVQQPGYEEELQKYEAGLQTGDQPDLAQFEETTVQRLVDSDSTVPIEACVQADHYDRSDFLPRAIAYYTTQGIQRAMPWSVSNPILLYNPKIFEKAGLDPTKPPRTFAEVKADAQKIVQTGAAQYGLALRTEPYFNEFFYAKDGLVYVNNGNGRKARATKAQLDMPDGVKIWAWMKDMIDSKLAFNAGYTPGGTDHLIALTNGGAAMTFEASTVLGPIYKVLASGEYPGIEVGAGQLPGLGTGGGAPMGDGSLWIPKHASPEKRGAAWEFIKYLSSPEETAEWCAGSGAVVTRKSAVDEPAIKELWAGQPAFRISYDQLLAGPNDASAVGSVIGPYQAVRDAVRDGINEMLSKGVSPNTALRTAQQRADQAIDEYNSRVSR